MYISFKTWVWGKNSDILCILIFSILFFSFFKNWNKFLNINHKVNFMLTLDINQKVNFMFISFKKLFLPLQYKFYEDWQIFFPLTESVLNSCCQPLLLSADTLEKDFSGLRNNFLLKIRWLVSLVWFPSFPLAVRNLRNNSTKNMPIQYTSL